MIKPNLLRLSNNFKIFIIFLSLGINFFVNSQETGEDDWGAWYMYFGTNQISDRLSIHSEAQFRFYETVSNFNQLLLRTGLNYHINSEAIATIGYAYINTDTTFEEFPGEENLQEHRIFQQFILKNNIQKLKFEHRYRLEQRFLNTVIGNTTEHRARYRLQITHPITPQWFLNFYDEIFLNLQKPLFGQNRLYGALGYQFSKDISLQLGYLKNHFSNAHFDRLQLALFFNTDFRKTRE